MTSPIDQDFAQLDHLPKVRSELFACREGAFEQRGVRLDIPSAKRGLGVVTVHERRSGGPVIGYDHSAVVMDATFIVQHAAQQQIGAEGAAKRPHAYVAGHYCGPSWVAPEPASGWERAYFNPRREHLFVDGEGWPLRGAGAVRLVGTETWVLSPVRYRRHAAPRPPRGMVSAVDPLAYDDVTPVTTPRQEACATGNAPLD